MYSRRLNERSRRRTTPVTARINRIWSLRRVLRELDSDSVDASKFLAQVYAPLETLAVQFERRREEIQDSSLHQNLRVLQCRCKTSYHQPDILSNDMRDTCQRCRQFFLSRRVATPRPFQDALSSDSILGKRRAR